MVEVCVAAPVLVEAAVKVGDAPGCGAAPALAEVVIDVCDAPGCAAAPVLVEAVFEVAGAPGCGAAPAAILTKAFCLALSDKLTNVDMRLTGETCLTSSASVAQELLAFVMSNSALAFAEVSTTTGRLSRVWSVPTTFWSSVSFTLSEPSAVSSTTSVSSAGAFRGELASSSTLNGEPSGVIQPSGTNSP
ncbi:hypothetical protein LINPERPRIM_LOCUS11462, partial [Linum perenne]